VCEVELAVSDLMGDDRALERERLIWEGRIVVDGRVTSCAPRRVGPSGREVDALWRGGVRREG
jgi:hypothetical protein